MADLITVEYAKAFMQKSANDLVSPAFRIYRSNAGAVTAATVQVTTTAVITTSTAGSTTTNTDLFSSYATVTLLLAAINARTGWTATIDCNASADPANLPVMASTSCYLSTAEVQVYITDNYLIQQLVTGVSGQIEIICDRTFADTTYAHWLDGPGNITMRLPQYPITALNRVSTDAIEGVRVTYTGSGTVATVGVSTTAVLLRTYSTAGALTATTLAIASYATLDLMAAAIANVSGWAATVASGYGSYRSAIVRPAPHANALNTQATLDIPGAPDTVDYVPASGELRGDFPEGSRNIYVEYSAGYSATPEPVKMLCAELVSEAYNVSKTGHGIVLGSLGDFSFNRGFTSDAMGLFVNRREVLERLSPWIRRVAA